jgi:exonuclease SbcD
MAFCFVHAADLHLDSPFKGATRELEESWPKAAQTLRSATFAAYESLIRLCRERDALFLLIAGDVYDGADRSVRAQLRFRDGLAELGRHGIRSFIVHGNHDPLDGWSSSIDWPEGARIFGGESVETDIIESGGRPVAAVSGISYPSRVEEHNLAANFHAEHPDLFRIALLHCNCGGNAGHEPYAPCKLDDLTGAGFNYWALGHVHTREILGENPHVVYPGNTQGRSIREPGERGCYVVTIDDSGRVETEFHALDAVRWLTAEVDIASLDSLNALDRAIADAIAGLRPRGAGGPVICRFSLTGRGALFGELSREGAVDDLLKRSRETGMAEDPFVWIEKIETRCGPEIDLEKRRGDDDLLGQLLRISSKARESEDMTERLAPALVDLHGNARAEKALEDLSPEELRGILAEAESLCVDMLEGDR